MTAPNTVLCPSDARAIASVLARYRSAAKLTQHQVEVAACLGRKSKGRIVSTLEGRRAASISVAQLVGLLRVYRKSLAQFERDVCAELLKYRRYDNRV
jgi:transcriptional regulator with XRE-family HTH domain